MAALIVQQQSVHDLWADAAAQLSNDERRTINFSRDDKLNIIAESLANAERCKQKFFESKWKYTRKSGETVIISDLFGKIVRWIESFKQIGDIVVQYDPAHAALPWAGVRLLLQITVNNTNHLESVIEGLAHIAELICRYALIESLFLYTASKTAATAGLERAIVKLYASVLLWLSKARQHLEQSTTKRIFRSVVLVDMNLESTLESIRTAEDSVRQYMDLVDRNDRACNHTELMQTLQSVTVPLRRVNGNLANIQDNLQASRRVEIIRWLSPEPYIQHHRQVTKGVLEGTGQWLLSDPVFMKWKDGSASSILWLHGSLGTGKSKLVSIVIEDAIKSFKSGRSSQPVFFYCSRNPAEPTRSDPKAILASLARQLSSLQPGKPLLKPLVELFEKQEAEGFASGRLQIEECRLLIMQLIDLYPHTTMVIDAMDECDPMQRSELLQALEKILQESSRLVKIFVSSRDDRDIELQLNNYPNLVISSRRNSDDIARFVVVEVERLIQARKLLLDSNSQAEMKEKIIHEVIDRADGMFLWASMQLQHLCSFTQDADLEAALGRLPPDLQTLYADFYNNISMRPGKLQAVILKNVLCCLLCAQRTLHTDEFLATIQTISSRENDTISVSKDLVLEICRNLVIFDSELDTFRFAHLSVREFLEQRAEYSKSASNSLIAEACLWAMLSMCQNPATKKLFSQLGWHAKTMSTGFRRLGVYADIYWAVHCKLSRDARNSGALKIALEAVFSDHEDRSTSSLALWNDRIQNHPQRLTEWSVATQLDDTIPTKESVSALWLFVACAFDFEEHIENILDRTVLTKQFVNKQGRSHVHVIVRHRSCATLARLLVHDKFEIILSKEIVEAALCNPDCGKEVMRLFFNQGGANMKITKEATIPIIEWFDVDIVALLLDRWGPEIEITEENMKAAGQNRKHGKEVLTLVLDRLDRLGKNFQITDDFAKMIAGNKVRGNEIMLLLLERLGAVVTMTERVAATIIGRFDNDVVAILLRRWRGAEITVTEEMMKAAAENYRHGKEVLMHLLDCCVADVAIPEEVVKAAARNRYDGERMMKLVLDRCGADVAITEEVMKAAAGNYSSGLKVIKLLYKRSVDLPVTEEVVKMAAANSDGDIIKFLCETKNIEITEGVIEAAATSGQIFTLDHFKRRTNVSNISERWTRVALLCAAAKEGNSGKVSYLVRLGTPLDKKDIWGRTPLWHAASRGHTTVVEVLLATNAVDVNARSLAKQTPLFWPAAHGHTDVVEQLLDHGALQDYTDVNGRSPLAIANHYERVWVAEILAKEKRLRSVTQIQKL